jgi:hypothetical protein
MLELRSEYWNSDPSETLKEKSFHGAKMLGSLLKHGCITINFIEAAPFPDS